MFTVHLEYPKFEKVFQVYNDDQVEARYLLSTSFMERLIEVGKIFNSEDIQYRFHDNSLLMTVQIDSNMLELGPITEPQGFFDDSKILPKEMQSTLTFLTF
jgi:hypothetical protein